MVVKVLQTSFSTNNDRVLLTVAIPRVMHWSALVLDEAQCIVPAQYIDSLPIF